jgi:hypothetical protein
MSFVFVRLSPPQTVMDVPDHACEFERGHAAGNQIQQHHRIAASGYGQQKTTAPEALAIEFGSKIRIQHAERIPRRTDLAE